MCWFAKGPRRGVRGLEGKAEANASYEILKDSIANSR